MHRLLERQLRRAGGSADRPPEDWRGFLDSVSAAYTSADEERALIERSMELASRELLEANEELTAERARLQSAFVHTPAAVALYRGPSHLVAFANPVWNELTGCADAVGRTFDEVFPQLRDTELPAVLDRVYASREPCFGNEVPIPLDRNRTGTFEETFWKSSGSRCPDPRTRRWTSCCTPSR